MYYSYVGAAFWRLIVTLDLYYYSSQIVNIVSAIIQLLFMVSLLNLDLQEKWAVYEKGVLHEKWLSNKSGLFLKSRLCKKSGLCKKIVLC